MRIPGYFHFRYWSALGNVGVGSIELANLTNLGVATGIVQLHHSSAEMQQFPVFPRSFPGHFPNHIYKYKHKTMSKLAHAELRTLKTVV